MQVVVACKRHELEASFLEVVLANTAAAIVITLISHERFDKRCLIWQHAGRRSARFIVATIIDRSMLILTYPNFILCLV
jgi:hypothetical protein